MTRHEELPFWKWTEVWRGKPTGVVIDLDNTLALLNGRDPYRGELCATDTVDKSIRWLIRQLLEFGDVSVIFLTGRNESARVATEEWLQQSGIYTWDFVFMRETDDWRSAPEYKIDVLKNNIIPNYDVAFVLDDDARVVAAVRELGIACWQSRGTLEESEREAEELVDQVAEDIWAEWERRGNIHGLSYHKAIDLEKRKVTNQWSEWTLQARDLARAAIASVDKHRGGR